MTTNIPNKYCFHPELNWWSQTAKLNGTKLQNFILCDYVNSKYIHLFYAFCCIVLNKLGEGYIVMDILCYTESVWPWHWPSKTNICKSPLYPLWTLHQPTKVQFPICKFLCGDASEILVFRKSRVGGSVLNLRSRDVHMAKATITLYIMLYLIWRKLLTK